MQRISRANVLFTKQNENMSDAERETFYHLMEINEMNAS